MNIDINLIGVFWAAVASMVVGGVWYAKPVFGKTWQKLAGLKDEQLREGSAKIMILGFILALIAGYVLAHIMELSRAYFGYSYVQTGLTTAFWLWLGISITTIFTHGLFERRRKKLLVISAAHQLVSLLVMGWIIGLFAS